jgi:hypothetical protein
MNLASSRAACLSNERVGTGVKTAKARILSWNWLVQSVTLNFRARWSSSSRYRTFPTFRRDGYLTFGRGRASTC